MDKYIFSDEEINKILLSSPMVLPNSPQAYGLKGSNIKSFFYDFIRRLMLLINEHFVLIERDKESSISVHNEDTVAHNDIRKMIDNLATKDTELGNAISNHYSEINLAHDDIRAKIDSDILAHENNVYAHEHILFNMAEIKAIAQNALNFASGKSKIIPVKDIYEMTTKLDGTLNIGDKFVLSKKDVPDFTLFEKNSTDENAIAFTQVDLLFGNVEFLPGESYLYNGYLLVASESGIDTSKFARQVDITSLEDALNQLDLELNTAIDSIIEELTLKENAIKVINETAETVELASKTEYNLGLRTSVTLGLPEEIPSDFECIVNFRSGATATTFDSPDEIIFTQDDCVGGRLYPVTNRLYEINIKSVGGILVAKVGSVDYEVIE